MLLSAALLLQAAIAGACAAHDAAHGRGDAAGHAGAAGPHDAPDDPDAPDSGEPASLHAILHAAHCGGCAHGVSAPAYPWYVSASVATAVPASFAGCTPISFCPDPSLRPPISA